MCVGDKRKIIIANALTNIASLRRVYNSSIAIELFYVGEGDLSAANRQKLLKFEKVRLYNLLEYVDLEAATLRKYLSKPFALLVSSFQHAMLIDADSIFLKDPAGLFKSKAYQETGTSFWNDRKSSLTFRNGHGWLGQEAQTWMVWLRYR